jgi:hypothetical protein
MSGTKRISSRFDVRGGGLPPVFPLLSWTSGVTLGARCYRSSRARVAPVSPRHRRQTHDGRLSLALHEWHEAHLVALRRPRWWFASRFPLAIVAGGSEEWAGSPDKRRHARGAVLSKLTCPRRARLSSAARSASRRASTSAVVVCLPFSPCYRCRCRELPSWVSRA